jgi:hypothetical protein
MNEIPNDRKRTKINDIMPPRRKTEIIKDTWDFYRDSSRDQYGLSKVWLKNSELEYKKPYKPALRKFAWIGPYWQNILGHCGVPYIIKQS